METNEMSNMIVFDLKNPGIARGSQALSERLVEGNPSYKTWEKDNVGNGRIRSGIWQATPGELSCLMLRSVRRAAAKRHPRAWS
jgi:uncharacterized cupin superfamily protein